MVNEAAHREVFAIIYALTIARIKSVGAAAVCWSIITLAPCITGKRDGDLVALFKGVHPVAAVVTVRIRTDVQIVVIRPLTEAQISVAFGPRRIGLMVNEAAHCEVFATIHALFRTRPKSVGATAC